MKTIRSSEIGTYIYCRRAWWYQRQGYENQNKAELISGQELHAHHGRIVFTAGVMKLLAYGLLLVGLVLIAASITYLLL
jgi:hypothetical protein